MAEVIPFYKHLIPGILPKEPLGICFKQPDDTEVCLFLGGRIPNTWRAEEHDLVVDSSVKGDGALRVPWLRVTGLKRASSVLGGGAA